MEESSYCDWPEGTAADIRQQLNTASELEWIKYQLEIIDSQFIQRQETFDDRIMEIGNDLSINNNSIDSLKKEMNNHKLQVCTPEKLNFFRTSNWDLFLPVFFVLYIVLAVAYLIRIPLAVTIVRSILSYASGMVRILVVLLGILVVPFLISAVINIVIFIIRLIPFEKAQKLRKKELDEQYLKEYQDAIAPYEVAIKNIERDNDDLLIEKRIVENICIPQTSEELERVRQASAEFTHKLAQFYLATDIPEKYRNLVPVITIKDYLDNGKADSFEQSCSLYDENENNESLDDFSQTPRFNEIFTQLNSLLNAADRTYEQNIANTQAIENRDLSIEYCSELEDYYKHAIDQINDLL